MLDRSELISPLQILNILTIIATFIETNLNLKIGYNLVAEG